MTKTTFYSVSIFVEIIDPGELWDAAITHARNERGEHHRHSDLDEFGPREAPKIEACLQQLADPGISWPGTEIDRSEAERLDG